jgi:hypothetical protein
VSAFDFLQGDPFGAVRPQPPSRPLPDVPGRAHALDMLREYISELTFTRPGARGQPPIRYRIPKDNIHTEQPPNVWDMRLPAIVFRPGDGDYAPIGLSAYLDESTTDKYEKGAAVQENCEWQETIALECWAETAPQRSSMVAGIEAALSPTEQRAGVLFRLPEYFDQTVRFTLEKGSYPEDPETARNRRWAILPVLVEVNVCRLVSVVQMQPAVDTNTFTPSEIDMLDPHEPGDAIDDTSGD